MKKFLALLLLAVPLVGCADVIDGSPESRDLVRVNAEPVGCQFLYRLETEVSIYDTHDAETYLRNRIADQVRGGNTYWIVSERTRPNKWVVFGPERAFVYTANVYHCPDIKNVVTRPADGVDARYVTDGTAGAGLYTVYSGANPSPVVNFEQPGTTYVAQPAPYVQAAPVIAYQAAPAVAAPAADSYSLEDLFGAMFDDMAAAPANVQVVQPAPASTCCIVPMPDSDLK